MAKKEKAKKIETPDQLQKRKAKEAKELAKWEKEATKPKGNYYIAILFIILGLVQCIDETTTNMNTQMQSEIAIGLFNDRLSLMTLASTLTLPIMVLSFFYKSMADKYGRKIFLFINTLGMGLSLFAIFLAGKIGNIPGIVIYLIAYGFINFFISNDTQVLFLMESTDPEKRQTQFAIVKGIGMLSVILIPAMRAVFMGNDVTRWNLVYIVPGLVAIAIGVIAILFMRESDVFLENRIAYLKMTDEERAAKAEADGRSEEEASSQGGLGAAIKFAFSHRQIKWLFITTLLVAIGGFGVNYYEKIADVYYSTTEVTSALMLYPVGCAIVTWINGPIGDRLGRKKSALIMTVTCFVCFTAFFIGCTRGWNPYVIGLAVGLFAGSRWAITDVTNSVMLSESTPTNLRASMLSVGLILSVIAGMLAMIIPTIGLLITHDDYSVLGYICIFGSIPLLALACLSVAFKVGDTTGIDMTKVTGNEWEK